MGRKVGQAVEIVEGGLEALEAAGPGQGEGVAVAVRWS
jgi:hypothetical protein